MTSGSQSKAQRRAETQRRAAEKRAAERRRQRNRVLVRVGLVVVVIAVVVVVVVQFTGSSSPPASNTLHDPHVALSPIPASMKSSWVQPPAEKPGPETVGVPSGPKLATLVNAASGQDVEGIQCQTSEQTVSHVHTHLTIFVDGKARVIPYGIGIPGFQATQTPQGPYVATGNCFYWLHAHANDGIIHVESPSPSESFTLGQFFAEWGIPLSKSQVGSASGPVTVFFTSPGKQPKLYEGDPTKLPLGDHYQIQLNVGTPIVAPVSVSNWGQL
jgi:hypothetical protein